MKLFSRELHKEVFELMIMAEEDRASTETLLINQSIYFYQIEEILTFTEVHNYITDSEDMKIYLKIQLYF